ncbi:MAG: hypothetical protein OEZ39_05435 [Gammaproteobacteria bacterium]|nr:hypothetical protein [Gammaproteobacteria bacterium]
MKVQKFRKIDLKNTTWATIAGNWSQKGTTFLHSPAGVEPNSFNLYVCDKQLRDGAIEGTIRVWDVGDRSGRLVFRRTPSGCYYAGIGGYGRHFAIVKQMRGDFGIFTKGLAVDGSADDIRFEEPYDIRVEFTGNKITLKNSGITILEAEDSWFESGDIGFDTYGETQVEFSNFKAYEIPPITELINILESFPYCLKRDYSFHKQELSNEKDVQRLVWTILRSHYSDLVDEEILCKFGLKHYQDDFGIPSLATVIEVKVVYEKTDLKKLQEELMVDAVGYFSSTTVYRNLVFFIYNKANKQIDSSFVSALESLPPVSAVVILPGVKL